MLFSVGLFVTSFTRSKFDIRFAPTIRFSEKLPSDFKDLMDQQKKCCFTLPGRDKVIYNDN